MPGLVLELQQDALNDKLEISNLLRKALVISRKLGIDDIERWLNYELNGYINTNIDVPSYRMVNGVLRVYNPTRGLIPFRIRDTELAQSLSSRRIGESISEIEKIIISNKSNSLTLRFPQEISESLMQSMQIPMEPILEIGINQFHGILNSLRNEILNWALELESKGIKGEGMTFSKNEKQAAESVMYQITNNIGSMQNSQLQQASEHSQQSQNLSINTDEISQFLDQLKSSLGQLNLNEHEHAEIEAEIATIDSQLTSPKPKQLILGECFKSVRNIIEGTSGSLVATGLLAQLNVIMGTYS